MNDRLCAGGIRTDDDGHVVCMICGDDLGPLAADPELMFEQVAPTGSCWPCVMGATPITADEPEIEVDERDMLEDILRARLGECSECHSIGACGYDDEGRPWVHVTEPDE